MPANLYPSGSGDAKREAHISAALKRVDVTADRVLQNTQRLMERLTVVTRPQAPTPAPARVGEISQATAPMAEHLSSIHDTLLKTADLLETIENHLEI